jgi:hypothetical protein
MLKLFFRSFLLRRFDNDSLFETLDVLQSKQLMAIDSAVDQAAAEFMILRELKRRGVKTLDGEV